MCHREGRCRGAWDDQLAQKVIKWTLLSAFPKFLRKALGFCFTPSHSSILDTEGGITYPVVKFGNGCYANMA